MNKFFIKLILFALSSYLFAFTLNTIVDKGLQESSLSDYKEWNEIFDSKINGDIIIMGSSRAAVQISPKILDSMLHVNSYNIGMVGWHFHMQDCRYKLYFKYNKKPKYIIQNVDYSVLTKNKELYNFTQFLPYLNNDTIKSTVSSYKGFDWMDYHIPLFKYRNNIDLIVSGIKSYYHPIQIDNGKYKGFYAVNHKWDSSFEKYQKQYPEGRRIELDKETQKLFDEFVKYCSNENIQLIMIYTPEYIEAQEMIKNQDSITNIFKNYASKYNFAFLDYSKDSICYDKNNFYNSQHLNNIGVIKFNIKLAKDLSKFINTEL